MPQGPEGPASVLGDPRDSIRYKPWGSDSKPWRPWSTENECTNARAKFRTLPDPRWVRWSHHVTLGVIPLALLDHQGTRLELIPSDAKVVIKCNSEKTKHLLCPDWCLLLIRVIVCSYLTVDADAGGAAGVFTPFSFPPETMEAHWLACWRAHLQIARRSRPPWLNSIHLAPAFSWTILVMCSDALDMVRQNFAVTSTSANPHISSGQNRG